LRGTKLATAFPLLKSLRLPLREQICETNPDRFGLIVTIVHEQL
jgi:hypothetical protein